MVTGLGNEAGAALAGHPGINHLSFTGSAATGAIVQAAAALHAVPVTLELGGKSPHVVFADADLDAALPFLVNSGLQNGGQTCSATSRILVEKPVYQNVVDRIAEAYRAIRVGPALGEYDVGLVVSARQRTIVTGYLDLARDYGLNAAGRGTIAGEAPKEGFYVKPTLFAGVDPAHRLAQEEIFDPVQVVIRFSEGAEAIRIASGPTGWSRGGRTDANSYGRCAPGKDSSTTTARAEVCSCRSVRSSFGPREQGFEALYAFTTLKTVAIHHG